MSYFMTISGVPPNVEDLEGVTLVPVAETQDYVRDCAAELEAVDGSPLYFVDDCETGTSHDLVVDGENYIRGNGSPTGNVLVTLIERLAANGNAFRIWWANNDPRAHHEVAHCQSVEEVIAVARA